jgi:hypothetical protein
MAITNTGRGFIHDRTVIGDYSHRTAFNECPPSRRTKQERQSTLALHGP